MLHICVVLVLAAHLSPQSLTFILLLMAVERLSGPQPSLLAVNILL